MKKFLLLIILCLYCISAFPWGATGHRATGWVAEQYLNKKARKKLHKLLKGQSLAIVSTWMDEVRSDSTFDYMTDWHWVTIPFGKTYEESQKNNNGDVIATLDRVINELKNEKLSEAEQEERIKILIHLIGDIHQPLHVGGKDDKGGNDVKVMWFRTDSNLHRVWDSDMIDETRLSYTELGQSVITTSKEELKAWQKSSIRDWARESQSYEKQVYDIGTGKLGFRYSYLYFKIVRQRILQAGVRIAGVLNEIYGK
ncbi:S1/P1 nuclease [Chryseosolibacter indicus]|uniref:S1/P1 nuclease n=1 Tax=Chryseosolibacter indicus TaxID=2782351 RepID=A0ABS5VX57_9BACT|nr:S1/P1 nuclease [Chryseosolibacter indicus]MBT1705906.1 S1/P1 nuclease [Chryseosolibacter indicus]